MSQRAARFRLFVGEDHIKSALRRRFRRAQPRWPSADDQHIAERVHPLIAVRVRNQSSAAKPRGLADEAFAEHPEPGVAERAHEGFVVEAGSEETSGKPVRRADVEGEGREAVLAFGFESFENLDFRRLSDFSAIGHPCCRLQGCPIAEKSERRRKSRFSKDSKPKAQNRFSFSRLRHRRGERACRKSLRFRLLLQNLPWARSATPGFGCSANA